MTLTARDLARRAIGEKAILDAAEAMHAETRSVLYSHLEPGDRVKIKSDDSTDLGVAYVSDPKPTLRVTDEDAFLAWVEEHAPSALLEVTIRRVSPIWQAALLKAGATPEGEIPDGCALIKGKPVLTVIPSESAKLLARSILLELEA